MNLTKSSLNNRVTTIFMLFIVFTLGIFSYFRLGKLEDPEFTVKKALIVTLYPGASSYEVEQEVTRKIEEAVQSADQVKTIRSKSRAGQSMIYVDLYESVKPHELQQHWDTVRKKVKLVQPRLPKGALEPIVFDDYNDVFGIFLAITGDGIEHRELKEYAKFIKRELLLIDDIGKIKLTGLKTEEIIISIDPSKAANLGIHPYSIIDSIKKQNQNLISGRIEFNDRKIRINQSDILSSKTDLENLIIQCRNKKQIRLKDVAVVTRDYSSPAQPFLRFNKKEAIGIAISSEPDTNVVTMGQTIEKRLEELLVDLPVGIEINKIYYQSEFVIYAIKKFMGNLIESLAIVTAVLLFTMGIRPGLIIASNLIFSILGTLIVMLILGINLQQISIAALILVMGMIVDNAIVVAEGAETELIKGTDRLRAVSKTAYQTALPLLGATLIASLAFMPIYLAPNNMGQFVGSLFKVVAISLIISWILAMTQTPLFSFYMLKTREKKSAPHNGIVYDIYKKLLSFALKNRMFTMVLMTILLILGTFGFLIVPRNFFADSNKAQFYIDYLRKEGTKIESVAKDVEKIEHYLSLDEKILNYTASIGNGVPRFATTITPRTPLDSLAQIIVNVKDHKEIDEIIKNFKKWSQNNLSDGQIHTLKYVSGPNGKYKIEVRFRGKDPGVLRELAEKAKQIMEENPKTYCVTDDWRQKTLVLNKKYCQHRGNKSMIQRTDISNALLASTHGIPVTAIKDADEFITIKLKYNDICPGNIHGLPVWGKGALGIPISQVTQENFFTWEDPVVRRHNRKRAIHAQCDPIPGVTADTLLKEILPELKKIKLPHGYDLSFGGIRERSQTANKGVRKYVPICGLAMLFILVMLFNSFKQPLIIVMILPFAIIGISGGLLLLNQPFGFLPMLGAYSLMGMLIKNAVVLIDEINLEIKSGVQPEKAVKTASINRMRPVLLTSLTTIFGMIPLLKDKLFVSMACTIMFGLLFATVLTLIVVPVLYSLFYMLKTD